MLRCPYGNSGHRPWPKRREVSVFWGGLASVAVQPQAPTSVDGWKDVPLGAHTFHYNDGPVAFVLVREVGNENVKIPVFCGQTTMLDCERVYEVKAPFDRAGVKTISYEGSQESVVVDGEGFSPTAGHLDTLINDLDPPTVGAPSLEIRECICWVDVPPGYEHKNGWGLAWTVNILSTETTVVIIWEGPTRGQNIYIAARSHDFGAGFNAEVQAVPVGRSQTPGNPGPLVMPDHTANGQVREIMIGQMAVTTATVDVPAGIRSDRVIVRVHATAGTSVAGDLDIEIVGHNETS